jgi:hypothetical protein
VLGGVRYRMFATTSLEYPLEPTISLLADATGLSRDRRGVAQQGIKNRMAFFRGAIGAYLTQLGARDLAALFAAPGA